MEPVGESGGGGRPRDARAVPAGWRIGLALLAALVAGCGGERAAERTGRAPNVLVLLVDALRGDQLGVNGYPRPTTPAIDRLAAEGVSFPAAFAHSTWTKPSVATLFTALYPSRHGVRHVGVERQGELRGEVLAPGLATLAERFQAAGYRTAAVVNQVHLEARFGFGQGFDTYLSVRGKGALGINGRILPWLEEGGGEPFFAYLHYLDVHWPYTKGRREFGDLLGPLGMRRQPPRRGDEAEVWARGLNLAADRADLEALRRRYDCEVAFVDRAIGELVTALRERGLYEETIIVVTADHGEAFLEHGRLQHGGAPYEELMRIPLVIRLPPALRRGISASRAPTGLVDLMPTLLELAGLAAEPGVDGASLVPRLRGRDPDDTIVFAETAPALAARSRSRKLLRFADGRQELFDLEADPEERRPLATCEGPCVELEAALDRFRAAVEAARSAPAGATEPLTAEELEALERLGYL